MSGTLPLIALALTLTVTSADAAPASCRKSCTTLQANCLGFARAELTTTRKSCTDRACKRLATRDFRGSKKECRKARAGCRPCCKLGGVNECARLAGKFLEAEPQIAGDPVNGRELLLGGDYMTCGIPYKVWNLVKEL